MEGDNDPQQHSFLEEKEREITELREEIEEGQMKVAQAVEVGKKLLGENEFLCGENEKLKGVVKGLEGVNVELRVCFFFCFFFFFFCFCFCFCVVLICLLFFFFCPCRKQFVILKMKEIPL